MQPDSFSVLKAAIQDETAGKISEIRATIKGGYDVIYEKTIRVPEGAAEQYVAGIEKAKAEKDALEEEAAELFQEGSWGVFYDSDYGHTLKCKVEIEAVHNQFDPNTVTAVDEILKRLEEFLAQRDFTADQVEVVVTNDSGKTIIDYVKIPKYGIATSWHDESVNFNGPDA